MKKFAAIVVPVYLLVITLAVAAQVFAEGGAPSGAAPAMAAPSSAPAVSMPGMTAPVSPGMSFAPVPGVSGTVSGSPAGTVPAPSVSGSLPFGQQAPAGQQSPFGQSQALTGQQQGLPGQQQLQQFQQGQQQFQQGQQQFQQGQQQFQQGQQQNIQGQQQILQGQQTQQGQQAEQLKNENGKTPLTGEVKAVETVELSVLEKTMAADDHLDTEKVKSISSIVKGIQQYGYSFFRGGPGAFSPLTDIPVGSDYVIGVGDRIVLSAWGSLEGTYELDVSRNGDVILPKVGSVRVQGVTYGNLPRVLKSSLGRIFKDFQLSVSLGRTRLMKVYIVGEVVAPGDYSISSLSTVINALSAAGGPTKNGSLRNLQIKRGGVLAETVDLYEFFLKGDKSRDVRMQPGDTLYVPNIGPVAGIAGNVRRPAIYELKDEKSLKDLLALANGINPTGYLQRIQVKRVIPHDKTEVQDYNLDPKESGATIDKLTGGIAIHDLDYIKIFPMNSTPRGYVRLDGYVLRPGDYALKPGMKLSSLLPKENLLPEYYTEVAQLARLMPPDFHVEQSYVNLEKALKGDKDNDIVLQEFDVVRIYSRYEMEDMPMVWIDGEVQRPGTYRLTKNKKVSDLILEAGNLKRNAYAKRGELRRVKYINDFLTPYSIYINLDEALKGAPDHNLLLQPFDTLVVKRWDYDEIQFVRIHGDVQRPGQYRLVEGMKVSDLVLEAGNIKKTAFLKDTQLIRLKIGTDKVEEYIVALNLEEALKGNLQQNLLLQPYDELVVRRIPNWLEETERYITLNGEVMFPGTYPIYKGERLSDAIQRAGGYTDKAYLFGAKFSRRAVQKLQQERMEEVISQMEKNVAMKEQDLAAAASTKDEVAATKLALDGLKASMQKMKSAKAEGRIALKLEPLDKLKLSPSDLELMGGDSLHVPQSTMAVSVLGEVASPTTSIWLPGKDVSHYLDMAGGPTDGAETGEMYVILADGNVRGKMSDGLFSSLLSGGFMSTKLHPGDTVVVPQKLERISWMKEIKDISQILANIALSAGVPLAIIRK